MPGLSEYAQIAIPVAVHDTYTYRIPEPLRDAVRLGSRVEVPLGTKTTTGFVIALLDQTTVDAKKMKPIRAVLDDEEPALIPEIIDLCRWAAEYYIAPPGEMLRVALPANMAARGRRQAVLTGDAAMIESAIERKQILPADLAVVDELSKRPVALNSLFEDMKVSRSAIERLRDAGIIAIHDRLRDAEGVRYDRFVILESAPGPLTPKQEAAADLLRARGGELSVRALEHGGVSASVLSALLKKGVVRIERRARRHTLDAFLAGLGEVPTGEITYSDEQRAAIAAVRPALGTFAPFLLEGVTGSGKTEVYIELMREVVKRGEQAILLVPEISLTPVFASRLKERFGERIAILHSNLSASERYDQWWRARRGEVDVAIGPRSALFTPFQRLGLIVVDEEGDGAYKQEETPRYNARDLAVVRAQLRKIPVDSRFSYAVARIARERRSRQVHVASNDRAR